MEARRTLKDTNRCKLTSLEVRREISFLSTRQNMYVYMYVYKQETVTLPVTNRVVNCSKSVNVDIS
jgi:hypothetical protein